jgi:Glycosyltransferase family 87
VTSRLIAESPGGPTANLQTGLQTQTTAEVTQPTRLQVGIALGFTAAALFAVLLVNSLWFGSVTYDFVALYTGASIVRKGHGSKLYSPAEQAQVQAPLFKGKRCAGCDRGSAEFWVEVNAALSEGRPFLVYNHTPFEALLLSPLAALTYRRAYLVWGVINVALWMLVVCLIRPYAPIPRQTFQYLILCFTFFPLWDAVLIQGQTSVVVLLSFTLTFICLKRRQDFAAGLSLGLGLVKFPIVLPFALICLLRRKWKLMAGLLSAASVLSLLSLAAVGPMGIFSYAWLLLDQVKHPASSGYGIQIGRMANVRGLLSALLPSAPWAPSVNVAAALVSALFILYAAWEWGRQEQQGERGSFELAFASTLVISEVTAFHTMFHDLSPTLLAILLALGAYLRPKKSLWLQGLGVMVVGMYLVPVCLLLAYGGRPIWLLTPLLIAFAFVAVSAASEGSLSL